MSALARWDAFLAQIEQRHRDVRTEAEGAARTFIASVAGGGDYMPLSHQFAAITNRLQDLESKIIDTWHEKVDDAITGEGNSTAERDRQYAKGDGLKFQLELAREELEPRMFAELARQRFAHAQAQPQSAACSQCGAALSVPASFRTIEAACRCGARTIVSPNELMRSVAAIGTHAIAQEAVAVEWRAMKLAERQMRAFRPPYPIAAIKQTEVTQIAYWFKYLAVRSQFEPELARDPAMEVRSRMEQWYTLFANHEPSWVNAGSPRERI